jgi:FkbM family methyltransferase
VLFEVFVDAVYPLPAPGCLVVDVGAHIGAFTIASARAGARVFAYEPNAENLAILERNLARNQARDVRCSSAAISALSGPRELYVSDDPRWTGRHRLRPAAGAQPRPVQSVSLDDIVHGHGLERIDLLKLDCEGGEYEILYAASASTLARVRAVAMECHAVPGAPADWAQPAMESWLSRQGFTVGARDRVVQAERARA